MVKRILGLNSFDFVKLYFFTSAPKLAKYLEISVSFSRNKVNSLRLDFSDNVLYCSLSSETHVKSLEKIATFCELEIFLFKYLAIFFYLFHHKKKFCLY